MAMKSTYEELERRVREFEDESARRRQAEQALRKDSEQYKSFIENATVAVFVAQRGVLVFVNPMTSAMTGYPAEELCTKPFVEFIHPQDREMVLDRHLRRTKGEEVPSSYPFRIAHKDGGSRWVELRTVVIDWRGEPATLNFMGDISARKEAEEALETSERNYYALFKMLRLMCDNVPDMIWAKDLEKRFLFANRAICRDLLNARDTDEPIGKTDMFFANRERESHPENPHWHTFGEICSDSDQVVMDSRKPGHFDEFGNVKGRFLFLDVHKAPFFDEKGEMIGTVGGARDVMAQREVAAKYRLLADKMRDIVWMMDMDLHTTYVSPSIETVLGFTPEERMVQKLEEQITPESLAIVGEVLGREMAREERGEADPDRSVTLVLEYCHKDGSTRWMESVISGIRDNKGIISGFHGVSRDITERRREEEVVRAEVTRRQREASLVAAVAANANLAEGAVRDLAFQLTEAASAAIEAERVGVWLFDEEGSRLVNIDNYVASTGEHISGEVLLEHEFRNEFEALKHAKYVDANDPLTDPRTTGYAEEYVKPNRITAMLDAVIRLGGRNLGVICFEHVGKPHRWQDDEISFACQLADQIALAISNRERRRAEEALQESEERYRHLVENTSEAILVIQDGMVKFVNSRTVTSFGYSEAELLSRPIFELIHPGDRDMVIQRYGQKIDGDAKPTRYAYRVIHKSSAIRWIEISSVLIDWQGRPATLNLLTDITDRKQTEEALRESEIFLTETEKIARLGGWKANPETDYLEWTEGVYDIIEAPHDLKPGLSEGLRFFLPEYIPVLRENLKKCLATGEAFCTECALTTTTGKRLWTEVRGLSPVVEEERSYVLGTFQDITERKRTEDVLRESEERFRILTEKSPLGMALIGMDGRYEYLNPAFVSMFGYTLEEIPTGRDWFRTAYPDPDYRRQVIAAWKEELAYISRGDARTRTFTVQCKGGMQKTILFRPVSLISGRQILVCEDITESIRTEEEKARLNAQLLQAQKMESVGRLAGGVAHDFNNMLQAMLGHAQLTSMTLEQDHPAQRNLKKIQAAAERSATVVRQLLAFARKQAVNPIPLDLNDTVSAMLKMVRRLVGEDIDLAWMPGHPLWKVMMDPSQVDQILVNLVVNARDAIEGVGKITVETRNMLLDETYCADHPECIPGDYVSLAVTDNGAGMSQEVLDQLFEPFFTTKEPGKGTGLGLSTIYGIVKQNNGCIEVNSQPGKGAIFRVYLPAFEPDAIEEREERTSQALKQGAETILLVEDEGMIRDAMHTLLEQLGYKVFSAKAPSLAIRQAEKNAEKIDLLITDVVMPEMNGRELAERLNRLRPGMKTLFMSGYTSDVIAQQGVLEKRNNFIQKPFSLDALAAKVREVLDRV